MTRCGENRFVPSKRSLYYVAEPNSRCRSDESNRFLPLKRLVMNFGSSLASNLMNTSIQTNTRTKKLSYSLLGKLRRDLLIPKGFLNSKDEQDSTLYMIIPKDNLVKFMTDRWIDLMNNQKVKLGLPLFEDVYGYKRGQHVRYWADIPVLGQLYKEFFTKKLAPNNMFSFKITDDVYNQFISNVNQFIARSIFEKFVPDSFHSSASEADIDKFFSDILEVLNILTDLNFKLIHNKGSFYLKYNHGNRPTVAEEQYFIYKQFQSYQRLNVFNIKYLYQNDVPCVLTEVDVDAYGDELIHREVDEYPYGDDPIHCVETLSINMKDFSQFLLLNPNWLSTIQSSAPC